MVDGKPTPPPLPDFSAFPNPGVGSRVRVAFSSSGRSWNEDVDLVELLAASVDEPLGACEQHEDRLVAPNGLVFRPQLASFKPLDAGQGTKTSTTIEISHPQLFPGGLFEWQHSVGATLRESVAKGFADWAQVDLRALLESVKSEELELSYLSFGIPGRGQRRAVLSPVMGIFRESSDGEEHASGCPCCLFSGCIDTMYAVLDSDGFYGVRLYAARKPDGEVMADCRINGADFPAGADALRRYAASWSGDRLEMRKQYVVVHTDPNDSAT